jgi:hypothetical protein
VPIHGNPGLNADFERIVGPVPARTPQPGCRGLKKLAFPGEALSASPKSRGTALTISTPPTSEIVARRAIAVVAHIRQVAFGGRRVVKVRVDHDLLLREIGDQHVVAVVETVNVIEFDLLIPIAVLIRGLARLLGISLAH